MLNTQECLIIDDDPDDQEIFLMCVNNISNHINCTPADSGVDAIAMLSATSYTPDFIFIDMNMPRMNGMDCLKALRNISRLGNTRIFMYSTTSAGTAQEQSRALGAEDFIIKPSSVAELQQKLSAIFDVVSAAEK